MNSEDLLEVVSPCPGLPEEMREKIVIDRYQSWYGKIQWPCRKRKPSLSENYENCRKRLCEIFQDINGLYVMKTFVRASLFLIPMLLVLLCHNSAWSQPQLRQSAASLAIGNIITLKVERLSPGTAVAWDWDHAVFKKVGGGRKAISLMAMAGSSRSIITVHAGTWKASATVTVRKSKSADKTKWVRSRGRTSIRRLLLAVKQGAMSPENFFRQLAALGYERPMVELNRVKTQLKNAGQAGTYLGESFAEGGTEVEMALLNYRKKLTQKGIREAIKKVYRRGGADPGIAPPLR